MKPYSEQVDWSQIKQEVATLNPELYQILDDINPQTPATLAYLPYGYMISDEKNFYIPDEKGNIITRANKYFPFMLSFDKHMEAYVSLSNKQIPSMLHSPGTLTPVIYEMSRDNIDLRPAAIYTLIAGARNASIMPLYGHSEHYDSLQRHFKIPREVDPKNPQQHFSVVKAITEAVEPDWSCKLLIFNDDWMRAFEENSKWQELRTYVLEQAIRASTARRNSFYLEHALFDITQRFRIKIKPFSMEMLKYTFDITTGTSPGLRPSIDESKLPLQSLTEALLAYYRPTTTPVIIEPHMYRRADYGTVIYNPLFTFNFSMHDTKSFRPMVFMKEIINALPVYLEEFTRHLLTASTFYGTLDKRLDMKYYSAFGAMSEAGTIGTPEDLMQDDSRFRKLYDKHAHDTPLGFPAKSIFAKALTAITVQD